MVWGSILIKLNLGCGKRLKVTYINIDTSEDVATLARSEKRCFVKADVRKLPFPDNCAVKVIASHLLEHFRAVEIEDILREWVRVLAEDGVLVVTVPNAGACMEHYVRVGKTDRPLANPDLQKGVWQYFNVIWGSQENDSMIHKCGFDDEILSHVLNRIGAQYIIRHMGHYDVPKGVIIAEVRK